MRHSVGYRNRTRYLLKKGVREKGRSPVSRLLREYAIGERVTIKIDPSFVKGMPHRRYHGRTGVVLGKRGRAYVINMFMGGYEKTIIARPEHISPIGGV